MCKLDSLKGPIVLEEMDQGGEDLISEEKKPTAEPFFSDELTHVKDVPLV